MIEDLPKLVELGALGLISFYLIFKGIGKMQDLTDSIKNLTDSITKLQAQNEVVNQRLNFVENRLTSLEEFIRNELREIKFDIEHFRGDKKN